MPTQIDRRLEALERVTPVGGALRCADDYAAWQRSLSATERGQLMQLAGIELEQWNQERQCAHSTTV